jgi:multiple sugar transport system substrate-binding protein
MTNFRRSSSDAQTASPHATRQRRTHLVSKPWRVAIGATVAATVLLAAAGCAPTNAGPSAAAGPVALRFSTWGNSTRLGLTQKAVDAFTKANPNITVTIENSEFGSYWDKLATSTAANDAPDVIQMDESYIASYGSRGALLDLDKVKKTLDLSGMNSTVLDTGKVGGALVGAPVGVANYAIGVNPKILADAGLKMPDDKTWTWDDLANLAAAVTAKLGDKGVVGLDQFGTNPTELSFWARQKGEEIWASNGQKEISAGTITSYFDYAAKLRSMGATPAPSVQVENETSAQDANPFSTNKAAFHPLYNTQISSFGATSGSELQLLRLPAQNKGDSAKMINRASMYWSISARTKNSEAAAKLVNFLLNDPAATSILTIGRGIPANPAIQDSIASKLDPQSTIALKYAQSVAPDLVSPPQVTPANASGFTPQFTSAATAVMFGQSSTADGATNVLSIINGMK